MPTKPKKLNTSLPPKMEPTCAERAEVLLVRMIEEDRELDRRAGYEECMAIEFGTLASAIVRLIHTERSGMTMQRQAIEKLQPVLDEIWGIIGRERLVSANSVTGELN